MSDESLASLLPMIEIAAFARDRDGGFKPVAPAPAWFRRLADVTFPFLGHILEEANQFWASGRVGVREWGPCAEVGEDGVEFHYKVIAVTAAARQFLLFQRDTASDRMRETLQLVRDERLAREQSGRTLTTAAVEAHRAATELHEALKARIAAPERRPEDEWVSALSALSGEVVAGLDDLARQLQVLGTG